MIRPGATVQPVPLGWGPRLRISGLPEFVSFIGLLTMGFSIADSLKGSPANWGGPVGVAAVGLTWCWSVAVRVAMVIAFIETDEKVIRWRSFFHVTEVPWADVEAVTVGTMLLLPNSPNDLRTPVLVVTTSDRAVHKVRASAWCSPRALERWANHAMGMSPPIGRDG